MCALDKLIRILVKKSAHILSKMFNAHCNTLDCFKYLKSFTLALDMVSNLTVFLTLCFGIHGGFLELT